MRRGGTLGMAMGLTLSMMLATTALAAQKLEPLQRVNFDRPGARESSRLVTEASYSLMRGNYDKAIEVATEALRHDPENAWASYVKGQALVAAGRSSEGVEDLDEAIVRLKERRDLWGQSVAMWGRARALLLNGQCESASRAFNEYAQLVEGVSQDSAGRARKVADACLPPQG